MGCGRSSASKPLASKPPCQAVDGQLIDKVGPEGSQGKGKGKGTLLTHAGGKLAHGADSQVKKGKGKGKGGGHKWQIMLANKWEDYGDQEDLILKRAYMTGQKNAKFHLRGQNYEYNFRRMIQKNKDSNKERRIRPPLGPRPPKKPLLPQGPMIVITVGSGQPGTFINVADPNNPGQMIQVFVPAHAKPGQKMAVPIPAKGETVESVQKKQQRHDEETGTKGQSWSTGGKVAAGGAAFAGVAAVGVGGIILGDHLAGGDLASSIGEGVVDAGEAIGDAATDAVDAVGDWAPGAAEDVGDWVVGAGEDIADWAADAGEDIGDWAVDFAGDAADWLGDAGEDIGDFVMDLF